MAIEESVNNLWPLLENKNEDKQNMSFRNITLDFKNNCVQGSNIFSVTGMAKLSYIV